MSEVNADISTTITETFSFTTTQFKRHIGTIALSLDITTLMIRHDVVLDDSRASELTRLSSSLAFDAPIHGTSNGEIIETLFHGYGSRLMTSMHHLVALFETVSIEPTLTNANIICCNGIVSMRSATNDIRSVLDILDIYRPCSLVKTSTQLCDLIFSFYNEMLTNMHELVLKLYETVTAIQISRLPNL